MIRALYCLIRYGGHAYGEDGYCLRCGWKRKNDY